MKHEDDMLEAIERVLVKGRKFLDTPGLAQDVYTGSVQALGFFLLLRDELKDQRANREEEAWRKQRFTGE